MKLIIGLGNPGNEYERTRHNAGFMAVDRLAQRNAMGGDAGRSRFHSLVLEGHVAGERCVLMKPMTFMNRSGLSAGEAVNFYKLDGATDVMVLVDDVALPLGRIRLRGDGGAGGHNGLKDIERALGSNVYPRMRIGIDPPGRVPQVDYVLQRFSESQLRELDPALDAVADAVECWIKEGIDKAMTRFNASS
jgi:PTH1 family peptidyl-tRNA hydrolase